MSSRMMSSSQLLAYGDMSKVPGNFEMECQECGMKQKNRAFCYFCHAVVFKQLINWKGT